MVPCRCKTHTPVRVGRTPPGAHNNSLKLGIKKTPSLTRSVDPTHGSHANAGLTLQ